MNTARSVGKVLQLKMVINISNQKLKGVLFTFDVCYLGVSIRVLVNLV